MDWTSVYKSRIVTADEAVRCVKSGVRIFLTGNVSVPQKCLGALVAYAPNLENVEICQALTIGPAYCAGSRCVPSIDRSSGSPSSTLKRNRKRLPTRAGWSVRMKIPISLMFCR